MIYKYGLLCRDVVIQYRDMKENDCFCGQLVDCTSQYITLNVVLFGYYMCAIVIQLSFSYNFDC